MPSVLTLSGGGLASLSRLLGGGDGSGSVSGDNRGVDGSVLLGGDDRLGNGGEGGGTGGGRGRSLLGRGSLLSRLGLGSGGGSASLGRQSAGALVRELSAVVDGAVLVVLDLEVVGVRGQVAGGEGERVALSSGCLLVSDGLAQAGAMKTYQ